MAGAENDLKNLCALFNTNAGITYDIEEARWSVSLHDVFMCVESGSTMRHLDGSVERLLAAHSLSADGNSLTEAVSKLEDATIDSGKGFLLANQPFGLFSHNDDDDRPLEITPYEDGKAQNPFVYDKERVRSLLHKYGRQYQPR